MRLLIIALAALPLSAATAEPPAPAPVGSPTRFVPLDPNKDCPSPLAGRAAGDAQMRNLNELPPANAFHAVYRLDKDGCLDPVMVGYQYGRRR